MSNIINGVNHQYAAGETVEALDPHTRAWRPARVQRHEPYLGSPGYRVHYTDATEQWHCHGGWLMESALRRGGHEHQ